VTVDQRSLGLVAWYDGWGQSQGMPPATFRRELTADETEQWRQGWDEGKAATAAWEARCARPLDAFPTSVPAMAPTPPDGFTLTRNGTRWACATCEATGLPNGDWMATHQRPHHPCPDCGRQLVSKLDGTPRVHTRCPRSHAA
jgi:hypothetical protein